MKPRIVVAMLAMMAVLLALAPGRVGQARQPGSSEGGTRFTTLDVTIDPGGLDLAVYQFELIAPPGVTIVGVEGGEPPAYAEAPYYDAAALSGGRIIVGALGRGETPPTGATRVARLHMRVEGDAEPRYECALRVAATAQAVPIRAGVTLQEGMSR